MMMMHKRAFTLLEMLLAMVITTIIVAAIAGSSQIMFRTANLSQTAPASGAVVARSAVDRIAEDLKLATSIPEQSASALTVTVPDRNSDSTPETIRYAWSGVAGEPLTRQYNNESAVSIATNVTSLNFRHVVRTVGPTPPPAPVEGAEQLFVGSDALALLVADSGVKSTTGTSQYFKPSLPSNAVSWKITRVKFQIKRSGTSTGNAEFSVMPAGSGNTPTGSAIDTGSVNLATLTANQATWVEVAFSNAGGLSPEDGVCLVSSTSSTSVTYNSRYAAVALSIGGYFSTRSASTGNWSAGNSLQSLQVYIYGTVTTQP
jgi:prepilin-type N-terminal cleavage/methylation domain-containing protein